VDRTSSDPARSLPGTPTSEAEDINDADQIVGSVIYTYEHYQAFLWQNGAMMGLGTLGGRSSAAYGINSAGTIVGGADTTAGQQHAFIWRNGRMTDLGTPAGWSRALAIAVSDNGRIVGSGDDASGRLRGFSYLNGVWTVIGPIGADTASAAEDVNSAGYVVGFSSTRYLAADQPQSRNDPQDVISASDHAWLYAGGTLYDLQTLIPPGSGWQLVRADAINENGQITGAGWAPNGYQHGFLLTPTS
jgi:probable HAF family extracellular repeat protein